MTDIEPDQEAEKMDKFCSKSCSFLTICILQLVLTLERLVFDFLGYMWMPIIAGFLNLVFILFGIFGVHQYRPRLLTVYGIWLPVWMLWNVFIILLYLEVGFFSLEKHSYLLDLDAGSESWWYENGWGCNATYNITTYAGYVSKDRLAVEGCVLDYRYIEVIHAGIHIILSVMGIVLTFVFLSKLKEEDDTFDFIGGFDSSYTVHNSHGVPHKTRPVQLHPIYAHRDGRL